MAASFRLLLFIGTQQEVDSISELARERRHSGQRGPGGRTGWSQIGIKKLNEAMWLAEQLDLDLVEVAPNAKPPVCRLMDYGKYKYEQSVKQREARKKQTRTTIKELRMKVRIGDHDFDITRRKAKDFLDDGDKVKVTIRFRGREQERPGFGKDLMDRLAEEVVEQVDRGAGAEDRRSESMTMVLAPVRRWRESSDLDESCERAAIEE